MSEDLSKIRTGTEFGCFPRSLAKAPLRRFASSFREWYLFIAILCCITFEIENICTDDAIKIIKQFFYYFVVFLIQAKDFQVIEPKSLRQIQGPR